MFFVDSSFITFNAYMTKTLNLHFNTPVNVVYDGLYFNYGNAYNPHTGVFTVPSKGLYVFNWTSLTDSTQKFWLMDSEKDLAIVDIPVQAMTAVKLLYH